MPTMSASTELESSWTFPSSWVANLPLATAPATLLSKSTFGRNEELSELAIATPICP